MKEGSQLRIASFEFTIPELVRLLVDTGLMDAMGFCINGEKAPVKVTENTRLAGVEIFAKAGAIEGRVIFHLEEESLPEPFRYKGFAQVQTLCLDTIKNWAGPQLQAVRERMAQMIAVNNMPAPDDPVAAAALTRIHSKAWKTLPEAEQFRLLDIVGASKETNRQRAAIDVEVIQPTDAERRQIEEFQRTARPCQSGTVSGDGERTFMVWQQVK